MNPAAKTPDTIKIIRSRAGLWPVPVLAEALGWEIDRLERTAREFNIELGPAKSTVGTAPKEPKPDDRPHHGGFDIEIDAATSLERIIESLPLRPAQALSILKRDASGRWIPAAEIADRVGVRSAHVQSLIKTLQTKLRTSRWRIDSSKGPGGGYRLVSRI